jgi:hypothetical protein
MNRTSIAAATDQADSDATKTTAEIALTWKHQGSPNAIGSLSALLWWRVIANLRSERLWRVST